MKKIVLLGMAMMGLVGCQGEDNSYAFLLQHPSVLKQQVELCQAAYEKKPQRSKHCEMVMYAAANFMATLDEQEQNQEKFGQRVLTVEADYVNAKAALLQAQQQLQVLQQQKAGAGAIQAAQDQVMTAKQTYEDKYNEMQLLLAVLGLSSPE